MFVCTTGALLAVLVVWESPGEAQTFFTNVTKDALERPCDGVLSAAFGDYDNDGWPDLLFSGFKFVGGSEDLQGFSALLRNGGDGRFADRHAAAQANLAVGPARGGGAVFGDYDNDGDLDAYVPVGLWVADWRARNPLLRNDRGVFRDVGIEAGLTEVFSSDNAVWLDYDRDGWLDLYVGSVGDTTFRNVLHRNNRDGTFTDVTEEAGLNVKFHPENGGSNGGIAAGDFNDDGWPDLYVGVFGAPNRLFLNDGEGKFRDATTLETGDPGEAHGVAVGDINNDGRLDIFQAAGGSGGQYRSLLLLGLGDGKFFDVTEGARLSGILAAACANAGLADIDNDGDLDLLVGAPNLLYVNNGDGTFVDQTARSGIERGWPVAFGDYDLDGFLDVSINGGEGKLLYRNNGNANHWLRIELVGTKSNRNGIGSRLIATAGELRQMREVLGGRGFEQDEMVAHFGLGGRTRVDRLEIRWPSGDMEVLTDIPADQKIRVIEGSGRYHVVQPTVWEHPPPDSLVIGQTTSFAATVRPALFDAGSRITGVIADLSEVGGPSVVHLREVGNGTYRLDAPMAVAGTSGFKTISIMLDQATSVGPLWAQLVETIALLRSEDLLLLDSGIAPGWRVEGQGGAVALEATDAVPVYRGTTASAFQVKPENLRRGWQVNILPAAPEMQLGCAALRFAFHPGTVEKTRTSWFDVVINDKPVRLLPGGRDGISVDLGKKTYQVLEIPLRTFGVSEPLTLESIGFRGDLEGTFYLDDLRLAIAGAQPTAVAEEVSVVGPCRFTLEQNTPNPFNGETAIRFGLSQQASVELSVFNLSGLKLVTLVHGLLQAGLHAVPWDGRDSEGREAASGIYFYRLEALDRASVETKRMILVR